MPGDDRKNGPQGEDTVLSRARAVRQADLAPTPTLDFKLSNLVSRYQERVMRLCLKITGDRQLAAELTQEALLTAWRRLPEFDASKGDFGGWLYGIARYQAFNAVRKRGELLAEDGVLEAGDDQAIDALQSLRQHEREELIRQASLAVLSEVEQEAVHLRYVEGMPQDRITELLGITEKSGARGVLQRCRRKLQRELRRQLAELGHGSTFARPIEGS